MIKYHRYMLSFQSHPDEVKEMQDIINSGKYFSVTFIKKDGSIRYVNGHKIIYQSNSSDTENRGKFDRTASNILLVWDNNRVNDMTGEKGQYISVTLSRLLYFKSGQFVRDYTEENADAITAAGITPEQIDQIKSKMKINSIVQEEIQSLYEAPDYNKVLGKVIATTQQMIDQARADDITAIEPDSTWETMYQFESIRLMNTQLVVKYLENGGQGWQKKTDVTNLTQDRNNNFMDAKTVISWIRRAIKKGYTAERRDMKKQDQMNAKSDLQEWGTEQMLTIADLGEYISRAEPNMTPQEAAELLQQEFQTGGDAAVVKMFKEVALGTDLQVLGRGKYAFKF
jgi:hypothetical protein